MRKENGRRGESLMTSKELEEEVYGLCWLLRRVDTKRLKVYRDWVFPRLGYPKQEWVLFESVVDRLANDPTSLFRLDNLGDDQPILIVGLPGAEVPLIAGQGIKGEARRVVGICLPYWRDAEMKREQKIIAVKDGKTESLLWYLGVKKNLSDWLETEVNFWRGGDVEFRKAGWLVKDEEFEVEERLYRANKIVTYRKRYFRIAKSAKGTVYWGETRGDPIIRPIFGESVLPRENSA